MKHNDIALIHLWPQQRPSNIPDNSLNKCIQFQSPIQLVGSDKRVELTANEYKQPVCVSENPIFDESDS